MARTVAGTRPTSGNVSYTSTFAAGVSYGDDALHVVDITYPAGASATRPCVILIHGGAWVEGDKREGDITTVESLLAQSGFVVFNANYRLADVDGVYGEDLIDDMKTLLAWVRANASSYGGDGSRVAMFGGSAGGHLALTVCRDGNGPDAIVSWSGGAFRFYDDANPNGDSRIHAYTGFTTKAGADGKRNDWDNLSPYHWLDEDTELPPIWFCHAVSDALVDVTQAQYLEDVLDAVGFTDYEYEEIVGSWHAFAGYEDAWKLTNAFLQANLGLGRVTTSSRTAATTRISV
jgi:acetyl esterase/lipase